MINSFLKKNRQVMFVSCFFAIVVFASLIRVVGLTSFPPSLYWEEAALGYDAYSVLKTGKDHHGHAWPIVAFESFGDYKPSLYFYALVPSIAVFGLTPQAVRVPSALAGVLIVVLIGLLARRFTRRQEVQLVAMAVAAISPWAIQFSRAGWEVNFATALLTAGVYFGLCGVEGKKLRWGMLVGSLFMFGLSMYTYHAARFIAPLLALSILALPIWQQQLLQFSPLRVLKWKSWRVLFLAGCFFTLLILPLLLSLHDKSTQQRFMETNIFSDAVAVKASNEAKELSGNTAISRLIYHRNVFYTAAFLSNYFQHFSFDFLFVSGDHNPRHSIQYMGQLYLIEAVFLLLGVYAFFRHWRRENVLLIIWLLIGIVPAALTKAAPHALRTLPTMPVFVLLISLGIFEMIKLIRDWSNARKFSVLPEVAAMGVVILYALSFGTFWRFYSLVYPKLYASEWQYGYQQMISAVVQQQQLHPDLPVYITREQGRPAMYYWFFTKTDPRLVQATEPTAKKDQGEFVEFQNIKFPNTVNEVKGPAIVASSPEGLQQLQQSKFTMQTIQEIKNLSSKNVWSVYLLQ